MQTKQGNKDTTIETGRIEIQIHLKLKLLQFSAFKIQSYYFKDLNLDFLKNFEQIQIWIFITFNWFYFLDLLNIWTWISF